ncbi:ParA family protein [Streptomyces albus]|uniref:ParA family protein n=1 Tax=Streptomyces albus TaxID=1888 RepID=UPI0033F223CE
MSATTLTVLPRQLPKPTKGYLPVTSAVDTTSSYAQWKPSIIVPPTFRPSRPGETRTYVVTNNKGGVGKTTTGVELAAEMAARGLIVRLIQADPQGDTWLPVRYLEDRPQFDLRHVFLGADPEPGTRGPGREVTLDEATWQTPFHNLYIVPCYEDLSRVEYERPIDVENRLHQAIEESELGVDVNIIDASRSMGIVPIAALRAANRAIVPLQAGVLDAQAMKRLHRIFTQVRERANPTLDIAAVLMTDFEKTALARQVEQQLAIDHPDAVLCPIRHEARVREAPGFGKPTRLYAPRSSAASDYDQLGPIIHPTQESAV